MTAASTAYLASPIDELGRMLDGSGSEDQKRAAHTLIADREKVDAGLVGLGMTVFRPDRAHSFGGADDPAIDAVNRTALERAGCVVALLPREIPTVGVPIEVASAVRLRKPVVVVTDRQSQTLVGLGGVLQVVDADSAVATVEAWRNSGTLADRAADVQRQPLPFVVEEEQFVPRRHYLDDAAIDLWVTRQTTIEHQQFVDVPAGCRVELPAGTFGLILGRSSAIRRRGILVVTGVIDVGYRGDLFVGCYNVSGHAQTLGRGDRVGQLLILPNVTKGYYPEPVGSLSPHERGEAGFGSTGGYGR